MVSVVVRIPAVGDKPEFRLTKEISVPTITCPVGEYLDPITKTCKPIVCPVGEYLDPYTLTCKPLICPAGEYLEPITKTCNPLI